MVWNADEDAPPFLHDHPVLGPFVKFNYNLWVKPAIWFRRSVVEPNRPSEPEAWYHRRYRRVPTIDNCYEDDTVCRQEANEQFLRDRKVEGYIVNLLRSRFEDCVFYEKGTGTAGWGDTRLDPPVDVEEGSLHPCKAILDTYRKSHTNFFVKYGELGTTPRVEHAYMKQKHRLMWERRHGPIGTGMKEEEVAVE